MTVDPKADALLDGPRGRRLCLEYAMASDPEVQRMIFWLGYRESPGDSLLLRIGDPSEAPEEPKYTPAEIAARIDAARSETPDEKVVRAALRASVDTARYWQEPEGTDAVAALPEIRTALARIAAMILRSTTASTWESPRSAEQWAVDWREPSDAAPLTSGAPAILAEWTLAQREEERSAEAERPRDPRALWSGTWWSVPQLLLRTHGTIEDALELVEDSLGWETATVIPVRGTGRVLEIRSPEDWAELCRTYPFDVTASRRHDWFRTTDRDGRWVIPDWQRVSADWDAVHLTTFAYLRAAATLIEIDAERASMIAGWEPDSTLWLADTAREWEEPRQQWDYSSDGEEWMPRSPTGG